MKKITLLLFFAFSAFGFAQSKSTGNISLDSGFTANFTLNNTTSKVTLVLTGPSDRWFGLGLGVVDGFRMGDGDAIVFAATFADRNFTGTGTPPTDTQDWTTLTNTVNSTTTVRTLTLERALTTAETTNDLQMPYSSTSSITIAWARANTLTNTMSSNHSVGFASGTFSPVLGVEDFSLNATSVYPNPASGEFFIKIKTNLSKVKLYNQTGSLVKTIDVLNDAREVTVDVNGIQSGVYLMELQNDSEKSWKKVIVN